MHENEIVEATRVFKKQIADYYIAQDEKPADLEGIDLRRLTPFQRALLVTDGTVRQFIEAYTLSSVDVLLLRQNNQILPAYHKWLGAKKNTEVIRRQVLLQADSTIHAYATSLVVPKRIPSLIKDGLALERKGIGKLIQRSGLETRRELLWHGVEHPKDLPEKISHLEEKPFLNRTYRIINAGRPMFVISELSPLC